MHLVMSSFLTSSLTFVSFSLLVFEDTILFFFYLRVYSKRALHLIGIKTKTNFLHTININFLIRKGLFTRYNKTQFELPFMIIVVSLTLKFVIF